MNTAILLAIFGVLSLAHTARAQCFGNTSALVGLSQGAITAMKRNATAAEIRNLTNPKIDFAPKMSAGSGVVSDTVGKPTFNVTKKPSTVISRQVLGNNAVLGQYPWLVAIIGATNFHFCHGSLISSSYILTTGRCLEPLGGYIVFMGAVSLPPWSSPCFLVETIPQANRIMHPTYTNNPGVLLISDIALLKLSTSLSGLPNACINPIRLPRTSQSLSLFVGTSVNVAGWGQPLANINDINAVTNNVKENTHKITSLLECVGKFGPGLVQVFHFCTNHQATAPNFGTADLGGPLMYLDSTNNAYRVFGVATVTHNTLSCTSTAPWPYTNRCLTAWVRVSSYLGWINDKTGIPIDP